MNSEQLAYDTYGIPYEEVHSAGEVLGWLKRANVEYKGSFAPLRVRDYFYAFSLPEYRDFRSTFAGYPAAQKISDMLLQDLARKGRTKIRPSSLSPAPSPGASASSLALDRREPVLLFYDFGRKTELKTFLQVQLSLWVGWISLLYDISNNACRPFGWVPPISGMAAGSRRKGFPKVFRTSNPGLSC